VLGLLLVTKNEAELLESNLRHHLAWGIDRIAVADNASTDATSQVVAEAGDRVAYRSFPDFHDRQTVRHEMLRDMVEATDHRLEWVGIADTDEFFWVPGDASGLFADLPDDVDAVNFGAELFLPTGADPTDGPVYVRRSYYSADESSPLHTSYREGKTFYRASWLTSIPVDHNCARHEHECEELVAERVRRMPAVVHHYMIQDEDQFVEKVTRLIEWAKPPTGGLAALRWRMQPPRKRDLPRWTSKFKKDWWSAYQRGGEAGVRRYYREQYVIPEAQIPEYLERGWLARDAAFATYAAATLLP
jgi:hypothetical protein